MPSHPLAPRRIHPGTRLDKRKIKNPLAKPQPILALSFGADASPGSATTPRRGQLERRAHPGAASLYRGQRLSCVTAKTDWKVPARTADRVPPEFRAASAVPRSSRKGLQHVEFSKTKRKDAGTPSPCGSRSTRRTCGPHNVSCQYVRRHGGRESPDRPGLNESRLAALGNHGGRRQSEFI